MSRRLFPLVSLALALVASLSAAPASPPVAADRIWFSPGPGTTDYLRLFEHPEEWARTRKLIDVFQFYQGHTSNHPDPGFLANVYDAFARVGAFRLMKQWDIRIAIEVGSVKEFYCTPDASGMTESIANTLDAIKAVESAGGTVSYLSMDEPFVASRARACGGPTDLEPTADRVATWVSAIRAASPNVQIGLIEAYPFSSADALQSALELLKARGVTPAFFHMDVDWHQSGAAAFTRDIARLRAYCAAEHIPFGVIITGYNGEADSLYAVDVYGITELMTETFGTWDGMPEHVILQSWAQTSTGLWITPSNLPEGRRYTHTAMLLDVLRRLTGATGAAAGTATIRR